MNIKEVAQICHTIAKNNNFTLTCPITENKRFTRCLGRVTYSAEGELEKVEFSKFHARNSNLNNFSASTEFSFVEPNTCTPLLLPPT